MRGKFEDAEKEYEEALSIRRELAASNPSAYTANVADTLNYLAILHYKTGKLENAEKEIQEVMDTCDSNMASYPMRYSSIKEMASQLQRDIKEKRIQQALIDSEASEHKHEHNA